MKMRSSYGKERNPARQQHACLDAWLPCGVWVSLVQLFRLDQCRGFWDILNPGEKFISAMNKNGFCPFTFGLSFWILEDIAGNTGRERMLEGKLGEF